MSSTVDKKIIDKKRQDNVELCKMFNEETDKLRTLQNQGALAYDHLTSSFMYENKYRYKRLTDINGDENDGKARPRRHLQNRDDKEEVDNNYRRMKREAPKSPADVFGVIVEAATTPRINVQDQARVENLVEKFYDDMSESKGKHVKYRKKTLETTTTKAPVNMLLFFKPFSIKLIHLILPLTIPLNVDTINWK